MRALLPFLRLASVAVLLAGFAGGHAAMAADEGAEIGQDLTGVQCRVIRQGQLRPDQPPPLGILCGDSKESIGQLSAVHLPSTLPTNDADYRRELIAAARVTAFAEEQGVLLACQKGVWQAVPGGDSANGQALIANCKTQEGGWPQTVVTLARGGLLIQGVTTPAALPVLLRAIPVIQGGSPAPAASPADLDKMKSMAGGDVGLVREEDAAKFVELSRLVRLADARDDHVQAEDASRQVLALEIRVLGTDHPGLADILMTLAVEVSAQHRYGEADQLFERATTLLGRTVSPEGKARLESYRAIHEIARERYPDALRLINQATAERRKAVEEAESAGDEGAGLYGVGNGLPRSRSELTHSLMINALANSHTGNTAIAQAQIGEALSILDGQRGLPLWWRPESLDTLARLHTIGGDVTIAERELADAIKQDMKLFGPSAPTARLLLDLAAVFTAEHRYVDASKTYAAVLDMARTSTNGTSFTPDSLMPMVDTATALERLDPSRRNGVVDLAFQTVQWSDHGVAGLTLTRTIARLAAANPAAAKAIRDYQDAERQRDAIRVDWAVEVGKPESEQNPSRQTWLAQHYRLAADDTDKLEAAVKTVFPEYAALSHPSASTVADVRGLLGKDEAMLMFAFDRQRGAAFVVTSSDATLVPLAIGEDKLADAVSILRSGLDIHNGHVKPFDLKASNTLYQSLFAPLASRLAGIKRLTVVTSSNALSSLPLAVLVENTVKPQNYAGADWLIDHYALTYQPSVESFVAERKAPPHAPAARPLLALGNPAFSGTLAAGDDATKGLATYCREDGPMPPQELSALAPLPDTAAEVQQIAGSLNAGSDDVLTGSGATEAALRAKPLDQYRVLYFATHGLLPAELHCLAEPGLALSPNPAARTRAEDGLLEASEVAALKLNADLVVLSACNTAGGGGEALAGLAESFFHAGARSLLVSHWSVPSKATEALMAEVFAHAHGEGLDLALQGAQQSLIRQSETAHPVNWAAFVIVGTAGGTL